MKSPDSIRGRFGLTDTRNSVHGADSEDNVLREINFLFPEFDPQEWQRIVEKKYRIGNVRFCDVTQTHVLDT